MLTHSPDPPRLLDGPGTAVAQAARPQLFADYVNGGWKTASQAMATGATAGAPGTFTPPGSDIPPDIMAMSSVTASPATTWAFTDYVVVGDGMRVAWSGAVWDNFDSLQR